MGIKKLLTVAMVTVVGLFGLVAPAQAKDVYVNTAGGVKVTNTEQLWVKYVGTIEINAAGRFGDKFPYIGYISCTRNGQLIAGRAWTSNACRATDTGCRKATLTAWDSMNPKASKTMFWYDYYTATVGSVVC